jgi:hypothetical protein
VVDEATRRPSTNTSVCALFDPRRNTPDTAPGPPFCTISTPGWRASRSGNEANAGALDFVALDHGDIGQQIGDRLALVDWQ